MEPALRISPSTLHALRNLFKRGALAIATFILNFSAPAAANPGDEVVIVYNSRVPESKRIAEHYADLRRVPTNQIFSFALSTGIEMSRAEFTDKLQKPLTKNLESAGLWSTGSRLMPASHNHPAQLEWIVKKSRIRYLVLCYGVPVRIAEDPALKESALENVRPELRRNVAAVDSELALLPKYEQRLPLGGPLSNPVFGMTNREAFHATNGILLVARLDGPSPEIAGKLVDKAIAAETNGLWGRAYFDLRSITEPAYKPGDDMLHSASEFARYWGYETEVDTNPATFAPEFPMSDIALYCGWYDATVSGPFAKTQVEFMPGAFAYHLHSYSGENIRNPNTAWVGPLLAKGATITMGSVDEPYLTGTPDISVFISRLTFFGFSFGEAAYAAQGTLSWQTTIVGDPLYRPFALPPQQLHAALEASHSKLLQWSYLDLANVNLSKGTPVAAIANLIESFDLTKKSPVLMEKLADLYAAQGKPSSSAAADESALKLNPSPQQRIRLQLELAEKLTGLARETEAMKTLEQLLAENPDYPAPLAIYRKLLSLAQKLNRPEDVNKYSGFIARLTLPPPVTPVK